MTDRDAKILTVTFIIELTSVLLDWKSRRGQLFEGRYGMSDYHSAENPAGKLTDKANR
jgi:hypothetical protein